MTKGVKLKQLYEGYRERFKQEEVVTGEGNADASLLLVGEAPGRDEVKLSRPFVGTAGKNLNEFLGILGIERDAIFITNAIKYRLSKISEKTGRISNRPAAREDIELNREYLVKEIEIISPRYIVTLGNVPLRAVTGNYGISIGGLHGRLEPVEVSGREYGLFPLYHPASIIYNRSLKDVYIEDIQKLRELLG